MSHESLIHLIAHHRSLARRYYRAVRHGDGGSATAAEAERLSQELETLEQQIVEFRVQSTAELSKKMAYIYELTDKDAYVAGLILEGIREVSEAAKAKSPPP